MKNTLITGFLLLHFFNSFSQKDSTNTKMSILNDKTEYIFKQKSIKTVGLYFASEIGIGTINNKTVPLAGGSMMFLINKKIGFGFAGQITGNPNNASEILKLGYGGLKLEYTIKPNAKVHTTIPLLIGTGFAKNDSLPFNNSYHDRNRAKNSHEKRYHTGNQFFIIQPGVNLEANLMRYLKVFGGINYRMATKLNNGRNINNADTISAKQVSGITATIGIKIGLFDYNLYKKDSTSKRKKYYNK